LDLSGQFVFANLCEVQFNLCLQTMQVFQNLREL